MLALAILCFAFSTALAAIPPFLNCTRYLEPCISRQGDCCGYPFYDCLSDGREPLCQSIQDFPELSAELLLRLRGAKDRGDPAVEEIHKDVYDIIGSSNKKKGGGSSKKSKPTTKKGGTGGKKKKSKEAPKKQGKSSKTKSSKKKKDE